MALSNGKTYLLTGKHSDNLMICLGNLKVVEDSSESKLAEFKVEWWMSMHKIGDCNVFEQVRGVFGEGDTVCVCENGESGVECDYGVNGCSSSCSECWCCLSMLEGIWIYRLSGLGHVLYQRAVQETVLQYSVDEFAVSRIVSDTSRLGGAGLRYLHYKLNRLPTCNLIFTAGSF